VLKVSNLVADYIYYFAHPQSGYFVLGNILEDQLLDYAERKGITPEQARRLLAANIAL